MGYPIKTGKDAWEYKYVPNLFGGIDPSVAPDLLDDNQAVQLHNVSMKTSTISIDTGYLPSGQEVIGNPQITYQFARRDATEDLILITTKTLYRWDSGISKWLMQKGTASTTTTGAYASGTVNIDVTDSSSFITGDACAVTMDNGDQLQGTITKAGSVLTFSSAVPAGRTILLGAIVIRGAQLNGNTDKQVSVVTVPGSDWIVFTNGVDIVKRFDGIDVIDVPNLPSGGNIICAAVIVYNTALFLLNTIEGGAAHPQRLRRSNQTDPTDWTTGTAGYDELLDTADAILTAKLLGPYLIVYKEHSIARGLFIGNSGINYQFDTTITTEGAISAGAIADLGDRHIFVGHRNIYIYRGDYILSPVGDRVYDYTLGFRGNIDPVNAHKLFIIYIQELDEIWIAYVSASSVDSFCDTILRYNITKGFWHTRSLNDTLIGYGFYIKQTGVIWATAEGTWEDQLGAWNSKTFLAQSPTVQLCIATTNQVMDYDYQQTLDNGAPIEYIVESKDFSLADAELRFDSIDMYIQGTNVIMEYSTDSGISWNSLAIITQEVAGKVFIGKQFVTNKVRFRWIGSSADFALKWFGFTYKIESLVGYENTIL